MYKIATIHNGSGNVAELVRNMWYGLPYVIGTRMRCGYWESRCELFLFACKHAGFNPEAATWEDGETGELLDFYELADEEYELLHGEVDA